MLHTPALYRETGRAAKNVQLIHVSKTDDMHSARWLTHAFKVSKIMA